MEQQTRALLERIASDSPVPGGGSVSALAGALGAALGAMVSRLTAAKQAGTMRGGRGEELIGDLDRARERLADGFDRDAASYEGVIAAYRLPKVTEEEQRVRKEAVQAAMRHATSVPLETARLCDRVLDLCLLAARQGYEQAVTDAGVGALLAYAGGTGALYNVEVNLGSVDDRQFAEAVLQELESLRAGMEDKRRSADERVREVLRG